MKQAYESQQSHELEIIRRRLYADIVLEALRRKDDKPLAAAEEALTAYDKRFRSESA